MNYRSVFHIISFLLIVIGILIGITIFISIIYNDPIKAKLGLLFASIINLSTGILIWALTRKEKIELSRKDGFGIATFGWVLAAIFGSLPFILSGVITNPVSAIFETMSGFTTTGASVLSDLENLPRGILFWRSLTHFLGGMGVLVLCVAILPFLKVGGMQIYRAEMPGPSKDRLTPRIETTAKLLWGVYLLLCVLETILLKLGGMSLFDALCHTFGTMATGGFSPKSQSVGAYNSAYIEIVIIIFMFLAGTNFALHYKLLSGKPLSHIKDPEFRFYFFVWLIACLFLSFNVWHSVYPTFTEALRAGFFQGTSILTTTGFVTEDFDIWPNASRILLVILMFIGGCAGSTGGGIKNIRVFTIIKKIIKEINLIMLPKAVLKIKIGKSTLKDNTVSNIAAFVIIFILIFTIGTFLMSFFTPDLESAFSSTIATLGNIGPGLSTVGATQNYTNIPTAGKLILTIFMLLGRLELYTVLIIFMPGFWRR